MGSSAIRIVNPITNFSEWLDPVYKVYAEQGAAARAEAENNAKIAENQAAVDRANAGIAQQKGEMEAEKRSRALAANIGSLYADTAGNGLLVDGSGTGDTLADALRTATAEGVADISTIRDNAAMEAWTHEQNARNRMMSAESFRVQGRNAQKQGELAGLTASMMTAASVAASFFSGGAASSGSAAGYAALASSIASGVASTAEAYTEYERGQAQLAEYRNDAKNLEQQAAVDDAKAGIAQIQGEQEAEKRQRLLANDIGSLYANYAGNGLMVDSPFGDTLSNVLDSEVAESVFDVDVIRQNTAFNVWNFQQAARAKRLSADASRIQGRNAARTGVMNAGRKLFDAALNLGLAGMRSYRSNATAPAAPQGNMAFNTTGGLKSNTGFGATNSWDANMGVRMFA